MDYQVVLAPRAIRDLQDIIRYISADSPDNAEKFGRFLIEKTKILSNFPELGRQVPEIGDSSVREIIVKSFRVVYRINKVKNTIEVSRFWHAARGIPEL